MLYWSKRFRNVAYLNTKSHVAHPHSPLVSDKQKCVNYFDRSVDKLYNLNRILSKHVDELEKEYFQLVPSAQNEHKDAFLSFDEKKYHLDPFFVDLMHGNVRYRKCWIVLKIVFSLSHGQADVKRRFSVNEELLVENVQQTDFSYHSKAHL